MDIQSHLFLGKSDTPVIESVSGQIVSYKNVWLVYKMHLDAAGPLVFPPQVATHLIKLACDLPDFLGRSLSTWTAAELARQLKEASIISDISPQSVLRILKSYKLKPWRVHYWLRPKTVLDDDFRMRVNDICHWYTTPLKPHEVVFCLDEKTSLQPRPRSHATRPAQQGHVPVRLEHEYKRKGALNLFAAFNISTGRVTGVCHRRKRQKEFIDLLETIDEETPPTITDIHIICDNVSVHHGKEVRSWLTSHPRFQFHFTPVHCSWMNQVEQWFSILQRKRLKAPNFADLEDLESKITAFIEEWNEAAHPFRWTTESFSKILNKIDSTIKAAA